MIALVILQDIVTLHSKSKYKKQILKRRKI